ncbi:poly(hydroxyalkanoate) depolymerase family esterase [Herbaspirillum sp. SJZ107]|nr:poly(hydroxyalkanoate) depolymerase family esterase [Herbaspirillum sp. SJZ107]
MLHTMLDAWSSFALSPFAPARASSGGTFTADRYHGDARSLRYKLFVPGGHGDDPLPLVVMLHGGGQDADDFALGTGMNELAQEAGYLVAYPEQPADANWSRCWNWFDDGHHQRGRGEPALIAGVVRKVMAEHAVDRTRVYVAGLSAGGAMAVILGRTYPDLFAAVGCHSGLAYGSATDHYGAMLAMRDGAAAPAPVRGNAPSGVPTIVFHGDQDSTVHPNNSAGVIQQTIDAYTAQTPRGRLALSLSQERGEMAGRGFTRHVHKSPAGNILAEHWTLDGVGHAWCGGNRRGSYTEAGGPDASREMLRFFLRHQCTGARDALDPVEPEVAVQPG